MFNFDHSHVQAVYNGINTIIFMDQALHTMTLYHNVIFKEKVCWKYIFIQICHTAQITHTEYLIVFKMLAILIIF